MQYKKLWIAFAVVMIASFAVLGGVGYKTIKEAPPIPAQVVATDGRVLFDGETIKTGQNVWQSIGGQEIGSIWGHGAYVAPDWTADALHRESVFILDAWAKREGKEGFEALDAERKAVLTARLRSIMRHNGYDPETGTLTIDPARADAFSALASHYASVFGDGREEYAIPRGALVDEAKQRQMSAFFWWTAWAAAAERPGEDVSYTQNWP